MLASGSGMARGQRASVQCCVGMSAQCPALIHHTTFFVSMVQMGGPGHTALLVGLVLAPWK